MKKILILILFLISTQIIFAQRAGDKNTPSSSPTPTPATSSTPRPIDSSRLLADTLAKNLEKINQKIAVPTEEREKAYVTLMQGQRFFRQAQRMRSPSGLVQAKESFRKAVEIDHYLTEGYTAIADVSWLSFQVIRVRGEDRGKESDVDDTIAAASIAVKLNPNSLRPAQLLAMAYTEKSGLREGNLKPQFVEKAIAAWKDVTRISPRNAEGFAFLSLFYERTQKPNERIEALRGWLSSTTPVGDDAEFYQSVSQSNEGLSTNSVPLKLAQALLQAGRTEEAIEFLNRAIAANPENEQAVELLREAVESGNFSDSGKILELLRQAVYSNPRNTSLVVLLADLQLKNGNIAEAEKTLRDAIGRLSADEEFAAADLQMKLGEIYFETEKYKEAVAAFQTALKLRKLETSIVTEEERLFVMRAYEKIVESYKFANLFTEAKAAIDKVKALLGKDDTFADDLLTDFYRETGKRDEALKLVRERRVKNSEDYGLLRFEATLLTELGQIDQAVALIKPLIGKKTPQYTDFTNYVFISALYIEAKRGKDALQAANQALSAATNEEEKQIAKIILASAQQTSGDFAAAEATLRALLKQTPRNPMALNNLGYFLLERNIKLDEALEMIRQAVQIDPKNASYLDSLGFAYFKLGKLPEAEKYLKLALRIQPSAVIFEHLGDVYQKMNKPELAKSNWRKALMSAFDKTDIERLKLKLSR